MHSARQMRSSTLETKSLPSRNFHEGYLILIHGSTQFRYVGLNLVANFDLFMYLLRFSKTRELRNSKAAFKIAFFPAAYNNQDQKQRSLKHRNTQNRSKSTNHKSQNRRSAKTIDGSKERKRQLAFELQNSRVFEKRSN